MKYLVLESLISTLSHVWTDHIMQIFEKNYNNCQLLHKNQKKEDNLSLHGKKEMLDYLLLFFSRVTCGQHNLYHYIQSGKDKHTKQWMNHTSLRHHIEKDINFIYVCLLPLLDNQGIISVRNGNYDMLYRSMQCMYFIAGHINQFHSIMNKYNVIQSHDIKCQLQNTMPLHKLVSKPNQSEYISKIILYDLCHLYGYDNLWTSSKIFGHIFYKITTGKEDNSSSYEYTKVECEINRSFPWQNTDILKISIFYK